MGADQYSIGDKIQAHERYSVFNAEQSIPSRRVWVHKFSLYYSDNKKSLDICHNKVKTWGQLSHPHIIEIFDAWFDESDIAFVTRVPVGSSVEQIIDNHREIPAKKTIELCLQAASCLRALHEINEPHGKLDLSSFTFELDQWLILTQPGWGVKLNAIVEEQNIGITSGGEEEKHTARLRDLCDWAVITGALLTSDRSFGYKMMGGQKIKEVDIDRSTKLLKSKNFDETIINVVIKALKSSSGDGGFTSFDQLLSALRDVRA